MTTTYFAMETVICGSAAIVLYLQIKDIILGNNSQELKLHTFQ